MLAGPLLHADLADAIVDPGGLDDGRAFLGSAGERFLDVDVFAGVERGDSAGGVPVIGCGDQDHVQFLHFEQLAVVGEGRSGGGFLLGQVDLLGVHVADGGDLDVRVVHEQTHDMAAAVTDADDTHLNLVVRAKHPGIGCSCHGHCAGRGHMGGVSDEFSSVIRRHVRIISRRAHSIGESEVEPCTECEEAAQPCFAAQP